MPKYIKIMFYEHVFNVNFSMLIGVEKLLPPLCPRKFGENKNSVRRGIKTPGCEQASWW